MVWLHGTSTRPYDKYASHGFIDKLVKHETSVTNGAASSRATNIEDHAKSD